MTEKSTYQVVGLRSPEMWYVWFGSFGGTCCHHLHGICGCHVDHWMHSITAVYWVLSSSVLQFCNW
jgi:hypothetical protein